MIDPQYMIDLSRIPVMSWKMCRRHFWCIRRLEREVANSKSKKNRWRREVNIRTIKGIKDLICKGNVRLVQKCAQYFKAPQLEADLIGEGHLGLLDAIDKFEVQRNLRFSTYACIVIKNKQRNILNNQSMVLTRGANQRVGALIKATRALKQQGILDPTDEEIAAWLNENDYPSMRGRWKAKGVGKLRLNYRSQPHKSLDYRPIDGASLGDQLEDKKVSGSTVENKSVEARMIWEIMHRHLDRRDFEIMEAAFECGELLQEIGDAQGVCRERVRQIKRDAIDRIRIVFKCRRSGRVQLENLLSKRQQKNIRQSIAQWISDPDPPNSVRPCESGRSNPDSQAGKCIERASVSTESTPSSEPVTSAVLYPQQRQDQPLPNLSIPQVG